MGDIYSCSSQGDELVCPEKVNREAIRKYAESDARWNNNDVLREYDRALYRDWPLVIGFTGIFGRAGISIAEITPILFGFNPFIATIKKLPQRGRWVPAYRGDSRKAHCVNYLPMSRIKRRACENRQN